MTCDEGIKSLWDGEPKEGEAAEPFAGASYHDLQLFGYELK
jgi:hypothetical protein